MNAATAGTSRPSDSYRRAGHEGSDSDPPGAPRRDRNPSDLPGWKRSRRSPFENCAAGLSGARRRGRLDWRSDTGAGGGMALLMLGAAVALMMVLGLVVDGGAKARALDHAGAIAAEAARAAAATYRPGDAVIDLVAADAAARDYLAAAGATGRITVTGLDVTATASLTQPTVFLPLIGVDDFTVTGTGQAHVAYDPGGAP